MFWTGPKAFYSNSRLSNNSVVIQSNIFPYLEGKMSTNSTINVVRQHANIVFD